MAFGGNGFWEMMQRRGRQPPGQPWAPPGQAPGGQPLNAQTAGSQGAGGNPLLSQTASSRDVTFDPRTQPQPGGVNLDTGYQQPGGGDQFNPRGAPTTPPGGPPTPGEPPVDDGGGGGGTKAPNRDERGERPSPNHYWDPDTGGWMEKPERPGGAYDWDPTTNTWVLNPDGFKTPTPGGGGGPGDPTEWAPDWENNGLGGEGDWWIRDFITNQLAKGNIDQEKAQWYMAVWRDHLPKGLKQQVSSQSGPDGELANQWANGNTPLDWAIRLYNSEEWGTPPEPKDPDPKESADYSEYNKRLNQNLYDTQDPQTALEKYNRAKLENVKRGGGNPPNPADFGLMYKNGQFVPIPPDPPPPTEPNPDNTEQDYDDLKSTATQSTQSRTSYDPNKAQYGQTQNKSAFGQESATDRTGTGAGGSGAPTWDTFDWKRYDNNRDRYTGFVPDRGPNHGGGGGGKGPGENTSTGYQDSQKQTSYQDFTKGSLSGTGQRFGQGQNQDTPLGGKKKKKTKHATYGGESGAGGFRGSLGGR